MKHSFLPAFLTVLMSQAFCAGAQASDSRLKDFDKFVQEAMKDWNVPGLAMGVVRSNEVIYARGFGYRDVKKRLAVTTNTLFAIGSTTKAFTTFLMGTLVDEGKLDWNTPVHEYLPEFRLRDPHASDLTTPRDLVTHRTGLPRHDKVWYNNNSISRRQLVQRLEYLEPSEAFRAKFQYNNLMYVTAGYLVESVTGRSWEENIRERIFKPLGMTNSNFSVRDSQLSSDFALPYREEQKSPKPIPFRNIDLVGPAGSINSSIADMSKWLLLNLNKGKVGERQLVNPSTLADIHSPQIPMGATVERADISQPSYCLGWVIETYRGHRRLLHGGGIDGFITQVSLLPDDGLGIVVFGNLDNTALCSIVLKHAIDRLLGLPEVDWRGEALAKRKKGKEGEKEAAANKDLARKSGTKPAHPLSEYAGEFKHPGYGVLQINFKGDKLDALFNGVAAPLEHWHYEVFDAIEGPAEKSLENLKFNFQTDVDGNVSGVAVKFEPAVKEIVFEKKIDSRLFDTNYLARFVGEFDYSGNALKIALGGSGLKLAFPGEPQYNLIPKLDGTFALKEHTTFVLKFVTDADDHVTGAQVRRSSGVVLARKKT
jgi:CubicO group peptidase (beta-lactamase class C family)